MSPGTPVRGVCGGLLADTIRYMNAAKYGLDRVFFGGCFIRGMSGKGRSDERVGTDMHRSRSHDLDTIVCYSVLVQGHDASLLLAARGLPVSSAELLDIVGRY